MRAWDSLNSIAEVNDGGMGFILSIAEADGGSMSITHSLAEAGGQ